MNYRPYPRYKDSGVEWLGEVPEGWDYLSLRHILSRNDGGVWGEDFDDEGTIVLRSTEMTLDGSWKIDEPARRALSSREQRVAKLIAGDLLVTKSSGSALHLGKTAEVTNDIEDMRCCFSNFMQRLRVNGKAYSRYLYWILNGDCGREQLLFRGTTTTGLANLSAEVINSTIIPLPSTTEQLVIAAFLDRKTAAIDALIKKKQKLIELLQEQRIAIISHAVTKGLNPKAAMKDSGVAWLGEVPEHWTFSKFGYVVEMYGGSTPDKSNMEYWNGEIPWVSPKDMKKREIHDSLDHITDVALDETNVRLFEFTGVLIVVRGMILAHTFPVAINMVPVTINQDMKLLQTKKSCSERFLAYYLEGISDLVLSKVEESAHGTKVLRTDLWKQIEIHLPERTEQNDICRYLDDNCAKLDGTISKTKEAIEKLAEYRTSLISAAVTGKIDVRSATA